MLIATTFMLAQTESSVYSLPSYFTVVFGALLITGGIGSLIATVLGFTRARAFGVSTKWFAFASVCLLLYHAHWLALIFSIPSNNAGIVFPILASLNLFVVLAAICNIIGFAQLVKQR